jgi:hypothetical protein
MSSLIVCDILPPRQGAHLPETHALHALGCGSGMMKESTPQREWPEESARASNGPGAALSLRRLSRLEGIAGASFSSRTMRIRPSSRSISREQELRERYCFSSRSQAILRQELSLPLRAQLAQAVSPWINARKLRLKRKGGNDNRAGFPAVLVCTSRNRSDSHWTVSAPNRISPTDV